MKSKSTKKGDRKIVDGVEFVCVRAGRWVTWARVRPESSQAGAVR